MSPSYLSKVCTLLMVSQALNQVDSTLQMVWKRRVKLAKEGTQNTPKCPAIAFNYCVLHLFCFLAGNIPCCLLCGR